MLVLLKRLLTPPYFPDDEEKTRVAKTLHPLLLNFTVGVGMVAVCIPLFIVAKSATAATLLVFLTLILGVYGLMRRGHLHLAAGIFIGGLWLGFTGFVTLAGGATSAPIAFYLVVAIFAGLLLGNTAAVLVAGLSSLMGLGLAVWQMGGYPLPRVFALPPLAGWLVITASLFYITSTMNITLRNLRATLDSLRQELAARKQAEEHLRQSEEKYRSIFENAFEGIYQSTPQGRILSVNPAMVKMFGYASAGDMISGVTDIGRQIYVRPEDREKIVERLNQDGQVENYEVEWRREDGQSIWVSLSTHAVRAADGAILYYEGAALNISERLRAETALQNSQANLAALIESTEDLIWSVDLDYRLVACNSSLREHLRRTYGAEIQVGLDMGPLLPSQVADRFPPLYARALAHGPFSEEFALRDGRTLWLAFHPVVRHSQPIGVAVFVKEITERKRAEEALRASYQLLERTLASLRDAVFIIDAKTVTITDCNPAATEIFGYSRAEMLGRATAFLHADEATLAEFRKHLSAAMAETGFLFLSSFKMKRKDETAFPTEHTVMPLVDKQGGQIGWVSVVRDITERKQAEAELEQYRQHLEDLVADRTAELSARTEELKAAKEAAEAANRAKSLFLANMSHELRTPLNAVLGFAQLIARDPALSDATRQQLAIINRSGEHLLDMINEVLDLAKIEAGRTESQVEVFDLPQTLRDLTEMIRFRAEAKGLTCRLELLLETPGYVRTDRGKLRQILINLLGNAVKFTRQGGVILRARLTPSAGREAPSLLTLEVEDTGPGIPAARLETIFEPFVQVEGRMAEQPGTGLGLTISRHFAHLLGGELTVETAVGQGSLFRVSVPLELATLDAARAPAPVAPMVVGLEPGQPEWQILVVEDDAESRLLLETQLRQAGFAVRVAANGQEAVAVAQAWAPHLIWMDLRMPLMDGYQATRQIRRLPGGQQVRIVALTASVFKDQEADVRAAGCDDVLHKPYHVSQVFETMARLLGVRYRYAASEPPPAAVEGQRVEADVAELPPDTRHALAQAALAAEKKKVLAFAAELGAAHPALAEFLRQETGVYRFENIVAMLDRFGKESRG